MARAICSVDGCGRLVATKGLCAAHNLRALRGRPMDQPVEERKMTPPAHRFWSKVNRQGPLPQGRSDLGPCWLWEGALVRGYGMFYASPDVLYVKAHRWSYEAEVGPIPDGLQIDHLCRTPACVNPTHLQPVTARENNLRSESFAAQNARKTHCPQGHPYSGDNLRINRGHRRCRTCNIERSRLWREEQRGRAAALDVPLEVVFDVADDKQAVA